MAAAALLSCSVACARPAAPAACSGRQLASSSHLSRPAPLLRQAATSAATRSRAAGMRVQAFQIPATKWWEKCKSPPNVIHINSVQQLVDAMAGAGERLVIVDFFAPWCAACKSLYPKVMKLVEERPDVLLLAVNYDENKAVVKALGVKVLPYFMFYRGAAGKLEEFSASSKRIGLIQDAIERHSTPRCFLPSDDEEPVLREFPKVQPKVAYGSLNGGSLDLEGATSSEEELPVSVDAAPQAVA